MLSLMITDGLRASMPRLTPTPLAIDAHAPRLIITLSLLLMTPADAHGGGADAFRLSDI